MYTKTVYISSAINEEQYLIGAIQNLLERKNMEIKKLESENYLLRETNNLLVRTNYKLVEKTEMLEQEICNR